MADCEVRPIPNVKLNTEHAAAESLREWLKQAFIDAVVSQKRILLLIPNLDAMHPIAWSLISSLLAPNSMPNILTPEEERAVIGESMVHVGTSGMVSALVYRFLTLPVNELFHVSTKMGRLHHLNMHSNR